MVTAKESPSDKKHGFLIGTDDYMVKPVDEEEMVLRIAALLRRSRIANERRLTVGRTTLFYDSFTVEGPAGRIELPQKEFLLLFKLLSYPGKIFTRRSLMDEIWDMDSESDERTVDVHISRLRDRFRENEDFTISTIRGLGYKAVPRVEGK
jgi:DNA-binding response OmpR family regulator